MNLLKDGKSVAGIAAGPDGSRAMLGYVFIFLVAFISAVWSGQYFLPDGYLPHKRIMLTNEHKAVLALGVLWVFVLVLAAGLLWRVICKIMVGYLLVMGVCLIAVAVLAMSQTFIMHVWRSSGQTETAPVEPERPRASNAMQSTSHVANFVEFKCNCVSGRLCIPIRIQKHSLRSEEFTGRYYTYLHIVKGTREVVYVGKGLGDRLRDSSSRSEPHKRLLDSGQIEAVKVLLDATEDVALAQEAWLIERLEGLGCPLYNKAGGSRDPINFLLVQRQTIDIFGSPRGWAPIQ